MNLTREQVQRLTGDADRWADALNNAIQRWNIGTPERLAMFLAQCAHESGGFKHLVENLRYSKEALVKTWPTRFTAADAARMEYDERAIAERAYGGRLGNAMEGLGDGFRFRGRGLIQLTGRDNYTRCGKAIGLDLAAHPEMLEQPLWAAISAGWFWATNGCNELADAGDYLAVTKRINGGTNGLQDRETWLATVRSIMGPARPGGAPTPTPQPPAKAGQPNQREGARTMGALAILQMFGPALAALIPQIANIVKPESEVAKRNVALAETIVNTVVENAGATNMQDAVEKMQSDPALTEAVKKAVVTEPAVMGALQIVEVGGGAKAAAERDVVVQQQEKPFWKTSAVFWVSILLLPMIYWYIGSSVAGGIEIPPDWPWYAQLPLRLLGTAWDAGARVGLANLVIGLVLGGICGVYYGISVTQAKQQGGPANQKEA